MNSNSYARLLGFVKQFPVLFRAARAARGTVQRGLVALHLARPSVPELSSQAAQIQARSRQLSRPPVLGPKVLFFSLRDWSTHLAWETTIAHGLIQRGAECEFFLCTREQPICDVLNWHDRSPAICDFCARSTRELMVKSGLPHRLLRDFVTPADLAAARAAVSACRPEDYEHFTYAGLPLGDFVQPSTARFLLTGALGQDPASREIYRDFLISAVLMLEASRRLLDAVQPQIVFLLNGLFFAERIMLELARRRDLQVVTYEVGFLNDTVIMAHDRPVVDLQIAELWAEVKGQALTAAQAARLDGYLEARRRGRDSASVSYWPSLEEDRARICTALHLDPSRKIVTLLSNILWDTAIYRRDIGFQGMFDWITRTIDFFAARPDVQLVVRIHPAEVRLVGQTTRERVHHLLRERYPVLPPNIVVVPAESEISSYVLMQLSTLGLVYTSTTGLEMALMGVPVVVAGQTHYRGKGFTYDATSPAHYHSLIDALLSGAHEANREGYLELARRYAHAFFFRFMIPFPLVSRLGRNVNRLNYQSFSDLAPGKDASLDLICSGILDGQAFILGEDALS
jgi:hypothetical protein